MGAATVESGEEFPDGALAQRCRPEAFASGSSLPVTDSSQVSSRADNRRVPLLARLLQGKPVICDCKEPEGWGGVSENAVHIHRVLLR